MRKRIFLAVSTSDLATKNRIFLPPFRIRSTALKPSAGGGGGSQARVVGTPRRPSLGTGEAGRALGEPGIGTRSVTLL